jgi:hypothetical protein
MHIVIEVTGNGYRSWLCRMAQLAMITARSIYDPAVFSESPQKRAHFYLHTNVLLLQSHRTDHPRLVRVG